MKQHELLAFESDVNNKANAIVAETLKLFGDSSRFDEYTKTYSAFTEGDKDIPESDQKKMTTTVTERLKYTAMFVQKSFNTMISKEKTNQVAKADIVIYDEEGNVVATLAKDVPVTALLSFEKKLNELRKLYTKIPTYSTEVHWTKGENMDGNECYIQAPQKKVRNRTETITERFNPNPDGVTDKFKIEPRDKKVTTPCGEYTTVEKTGRISPKDKADMLERLDKVLAAVKIARSQANAVEVVEEKEAGREILNFING